MVEIDTPEYYRIVIKAYVNTSNHEKVPFDPTVMNLIVDNFEYLLSINIIPPFCFHNLLYLEMEYQEKNGFILSDLNKELIAYFRKNNKSTFLKYCGELAYLQLARQI
jgi:hypothetical protein